MDALAGREDRLVLRSVEITAGLPGLVNAVTRTC
jgi:hypothetical protein